MKTKTLKRSRSSDDEDRSRSKKPAKSSKRRRRRRDSASSSGDDDRRRRRRRISGGRDKNPGDGRRKEPKRPGRKRAAPRRSRYSSPPPPPSSSSVSSYSSRSCSTCRSRSVSSSPERYRRAKVRPRSRSRGREKEKKRGRSRKTSKRSPSCSTCSRSPSRTHTDERRYKEESDQARRIRSESGVNDAKDEERDKIIQAYDDFPSTQSNEGFDGKKSEKEMVSKNIETEPTENVDGVGIVLASEKSKIAVSSENLEADDLELVLRQKALENFKKFRGGVPAQRSSGDHKDVGVVVDAKDAKISSIASFQRQGGIQGGSGLTRPRVRSVVSIPTENKGGDGGVSIICPCDNSENLEPIDQTNEAPDALNQLKRLEGDNNQMPSEQTTVAKDQILHNKTATAEHGSNIGKTLEGSASGTSASVVTKVGNEAVVEDTTGSQFEQKTFSRMHDGEMVQVSYKVYIPKKTPAMARRQLQR
ncbi:micronuclear linker histone polyprotein-like [Ananas comosus]|uniref:Micronuclear linker histone polyprotein-like n=1 Tax=Ananas comosus TaxID=4615 RepID=A0A6P5FH00_ANACO|nr:micronuclear linker histone polyprotein-like [Ananas comosus]XP_020092743.1 micronuclear linker histone polyprotein-like [Ananas comosus]